MAGTAGGWDDPGKGGRRPGRKGCPAGPGTLEARRSAGRGGPGVLTCLRGSSGPRDAVGPGRRVFLLAA